MKTLLSALFFLAGIMALVLLPSSSRIMSETIGEALPSALTDAPPDRHNSLDELTVGQIHLPVQTAGEWYVATSGDDRNSCRSQATPCRTIQAAMDRASDGHRINIGAGTYRENLIVDYAKRLVLQGEDTKRTIIDGQNETHVLAIAKPGPFIEVNDLTMTNGYSLLGGGIYNAGIVQLNRVLLSENTARYGGGIYNCGRAVFNTSVISSNTAYAVGGGIATNGIQPCAGNSTALEHDCPDSQLIISNCTVVNNSATMDGGGLFLNYGDHEHVTNSCIIGNTDTSVDMCCIIPESIPFSEQASVGSTDINFRGNWWGASDGPTRWEDGRLLGSGDSIGCDLIEYDPWLGSPPFPCITNKPAIVFVHGWSGLSSGPGGQCSSPDPDVYFGLIDDQLEQAGYHVEFAHLITSPCLTPHIVSNVPHLTAAIDRAKAKTGQDRVILIAHSMGGLVSRAYIEGPSFRDDVSTLITLGTPHKGAPVQRLSYLFQQLVNRHVGLQAFCQFQAGACDFSESGIISFNRHFSRRASDVWYYLISGDAPFTSRNPLGNIMRVLVPGADDGIVPTESGLGLPNVYARWRTDEVHIEVLGPRTYFIRDKKPSQSYTKYLEPLLVPSLASNQDSASSPMVQLEAEDALAQRTPIDDGIVLPRQSAIRTIPLEGGPTFFAAQWHTGTVTMTLVSPHGQLIDPGYAASNPQAVSYESSGTAAAYHVTNAVAGNWLLALSGASDLPVEGTAYASFAAFDSDIVLTAGVDRLWYTPGSSATITASLSGSPASATVSATLLLPDDSTEAASLASLGNGDFRATYPIPDAPGYVEIRIAAAGLSWSGVAFERGQDLVFQVSSEVDALNGTYDDAPQAASSGPPHYSVLQVTVGIDSSASGTVGLSADLVDAAGAFVAHTFTAENVVAGVNRLTLHFRGEDIYASRRDGPYKLTNLLLTDYRNATLVIAEAQDVYTTSPYKYEDFGLHTSFLPVTLKNYSALPPPPPPARVKDVTLNQVYVAHYPNQLKTSYRPGEITLLKLLSVNHTDEAIPVTYTWSVYDPVGANVPSLSWDDYAASVPPEPYVLELEREIPADAIQGEYTYSVTASYDERTIERATTFVVEGDLVPLKLLRAVAAKEIDKYWRPVTISNVFTPADSYVYACTIWEGAYGDHTFRQEWYRPNGSYAGGFSYEFSSDDSIEYLVGQLPVSALSGHPGVWTVDIYMDGPDVDTIWFHFETDGRGHSSGGTEPTLPVEADNVPDKLSIGPEPAVTREVDSGPGSKEP